MAFEKDLKKIDHRSWNYIRDKWLGYLPEINPPGNAPDEEIADLLDIEEIAGQASIAAGLQIRKEVTYLRSEIFREGIYLFHKASNVNNSGLFHIENGILSWSISSAYHSSFFSLKSILCLLGLSFPRVKSKNKCLMIDCFPENEKLSSKQKKNNYQPPPELKFLLMSDIGHEHYWSILQRVIRVSNIPIWDQEITKYLISFNPSDFTIQRNSIHYKNNFWLIVEDLFTRKQEPNFAHFTNLFNSISKIKKENLDYSFLISFLLLHLSYTLIKDISTVAPILSEEFGLINNYLADESNIRMVKSIKF